MKRVIIVHQWYGHPESDWYPWLKASLEEKGFHVEVLAMPDPDKPTIQEWVSFLENHVGDVDNHTFLVGHSIGCQTILRFLQELPESTTIGGAVFVAGWVHLTSAVTDDETENTIARPWLDTPIHWDTVKAHLPQSVALFSDNDPYVPLQDAEIFEKKLDSQIHILNKKGHFTTDDGITELPEVLKIVTEMAVDS